jgi:predicted nucleic acid-binding protein
MTLVDTSVWVEHLRRGNARVKGLLSGGEVLCHPFVLGELACGNLQKRRQVLALVSALPVAELASHEEVLHLVETHQLFGRGLGWVDVHLLASAFVSKCGLWTLDKPLVTAARRLGIAV